MALCQCPEGHPRCEFYHCGNRADWSQMVPISWSRPLRLGPKFVCDSCWQYFREAWAKPLKGIDRPENADEGWHGSILDHIRHGQIALTFSERNTKEKALSDMGDLRRHGDEKYTLAQLKQLAVQRRCLQGIRAVVGSPTGERT